MKNVLELFSEFFKGFFEYFIKTVVYLVGAMIIIIGISSAFASEKISMNEYLSQKLYEEEESYNSAKDDNFSTMRPPKWTYVNVSSAHSLSKSRDSIIITFNNFTACFNYLKEAPLTQDSNIIHCVNQHNGNIFELTKSLKNYNKTNQ